MRARFLKQSRGVIDVESLQVPFIIRRSKRARNRFSYRLDPILGLIITIPTGSSPQAALEGLKTKRGWLLGALEKQQPCGNMFLGSPLLVKFEKGLSAARLKEGELHLPDTGEEHEQQLVSWYVLQAKLYLEQHLPPLAKLMGVCPVKVRIKDQRSRWGSCSNKGGLNFNWRLIMAPPYVFEATIIHELAHLKELNHSAKFWAIVHNYAPRYSEASAWLKGNGARLRAWRYAGKEGVTTD